MNRFSKKDIKQLLDSSKEGTPLYEYLLENGCNQNSLKNLLLMLPNLVEYKYVFELPLNQVPKTINDPRIQGYCLWRWALKK